MLLAGKESGIDPRIQLLRVSERRNPYKKRFIL